MSSAYEAPLGQPCVQFLLLVPFCPTGGHLNPFGGFNKEF